MHPIKIQHELHDQSSESSRPRAVVASQYSEQWLSSTSPGPAAAMKWNAQLGFIMTSRLSRADELLEMTG